MTRTSVGGRALAADALPTTARLTAFAPSAAAKYGDTQITGIGVVQTVDCTDATLLVNGSYNTVVADHVVNDITVYGFGQTALFKTGEPAMIDHGPA